MPVLFWYEVKQSLEGGFVGFLSSGSTSMQTRLRKVPTAPHSTLISGTDNIPSIQKL